MPVMPVASAEKNDHTNGSTNSANSARPTSDSTENNRRLLREPAACGEHRFCQKSCLQAAEIARRHVTVVFSWSFSHLQHDPCDAELLQQRVLNVLGRLYSTPAPNPQPK